ncbi:hypothetical protein [Streptomyces sp. KR55]|uniref:hypothetical protein n=1 Tax=Streptomyces sp. KR55 TaxID=3457425 RepID=UPI003FCEE8A6
MHSNIRTRRLVFAARAVAHAAVAAVAKGHSGDRGGTGALSRPDTPPSPDPRKHVPGWAHGGAPQVGDARVGQCRANVPSETPDT